MRTTLDIDDDLLLAAKELARQEGSTTGRIVSRLLRSSLTTSNPTHGKGGRRRKSAKPFGHFAAKSGLVTTDEQVDAIREAEGI